MIETVNCSGTHALLRSLEPSDLPGLASLLAEVYGPDHRTSDKNFLRWQYWDNPHGSPIGYVAEVEGRLVATYTLIPIPFVVHERHVPVMLSLNTATRPSWRRRGLFVELARRSYSAAEKRGIPLAIGLPNSSSVRALLDHLGWRNAGRMRAYARVLRARALVGEWWRGRGWRRRERIVGGIDELPHDADIARAAQLFETFAAHSNLPARPHFSEAHVDWRYRRRPRSPYQFEWSSTRDAVVVCHHGMLWGVETTALAEFGAESCGIGSRGLADAVTRAVATARTRGAALVFTLVTANHPALPALRGAGLGPVPHMMLPHAPDVCVRPDSDDFMASIDDALLSAGTFDVV